MTHTRQEASCPCGSGKSLYSCHGASLAPFAEEDPEGVRSAVYFALLEFASQSRFETIWRTAREQLVDACIRQGTVDHSEALLEYDVAQANVAAYVCLDLDLGDGRCIARRFLDGQPRGLGAAGRKFLEALVDTRPSLYEVESVSRSGRRSLRDMRSGELFLVDEDHRSSALTAGAIVGTRLVHRPSGFCGVEGELVPFPPDLVESVVDETEDLLQALHSSQNGEWQTAASRFVLQLHQQWFSAVLLPLLEPPADPEEPEPSMCLMRFRIRDEKRLRSAIRDASEFLGSAPGEWEWFPPGLDDDQPHGLISWHGVWLVLETRSRRDAEQFERAILEIAPDTLTLRSLEFLDPTEEEAESLFEERSWRWRRFTLLGDEDRG